MNQTNSRPNASFQPLPITQRELDIIQSIRKIRFGKVVVHIQDAIPIRKEVTESIKVHEAD